MSHKEKSDDPTVDLFPDDDADERGGKYLLSAYVYQSLLLKI